MAKEGALAPNMEERGDEKADKKEDAGERGLDVES